MQLKHSCRIIHIHDWHNFTRGNKKNGQEIYSQHDDGTVTVSGFSGQGSW